ncbi:hypothetical protein [Mesorhizobium sp.]|uniref:hypothetical protein n=1 Tax=Mesorhizobium sp. TaxID=1871066 RepID=UPI0025C24803|nr:hypothetical protein [Mesorhizobium sp.]
MRPSLHHVEPGIKDQLEVAHQPIKNVYFPERGIASVVATMTGGRQGEVGIVGYDGMKKNCRHSRKGKHYLAPAG